MLETFLHLPVTKLEWLDVDTWFVFSKTKCEGEYKYGQELYKSGVAVFHVKNYENESYLLNNGDKYIVDAGCLYKYVKKINILNNGIHR